MSARLRTVANDNESPMKAVSSFVERLGVGSYSFSLRALVYVTQMVILKVLCIEGGRI